MRIQDHPFQVLGISARSGKRDILERAELAVSANPEKATSSRQQVAHPTKRIDAEVSWFPGVSPARVRQLLDELRRDANLPLSFEAKLTGVDELGRFNALAYWLLERNGVSGPTWALGLHHLSKNARAIDVTSVLETINADRAAAGFPQLTDQGALQKVITEHLDSAGRSLAGQLVTHSERHAQVLALIVERETEEGGDLASEFIERFVDHYQIQVQPLLEAKRRGIEAACEQLFSAVASPGHSKLVMEAAIAQVEKRVSDWGELARPIQLITKSRGLKDVHSIDVARKVRSAAIRLANEFEMHQEAQRITVGLAEAFRDVPEIAEATAEDVTALDEIMSERAARQERQEERRKEVELDIVIGRDRLQIAVDFVQYKDVRMKTEDICSLRWGIYKHYVNGVRVQRNFTIWAEASSCPITMEIECVRFAEPESKVLERYSTIIDKLWKAAGVRILLETAGRLMSGETMQIGETSVSKKGIWLGKRSWLRSEPYFANWEELTKVTASGQLKIGSSREPKASATLSLRDVDNAVVLERLLGILWKDGNYARLEAGTLFQE